MKIIFAKGYEEIDWLCVDINKGSSTLAEKLGFKSNNNYDSFSSYPPIENIKDLSEPEWSEWGEYLEYASQIEECLIWDCLHCYIKANDIDKTIRIMTSMKQKNITLDYLKFNNYINSLQDDGLCSDFRSQAWVDFLDIECGGIYV